jgi:hypothetical protein
LVGDLALAQARQHQDNGPFSIFLGPVTRYLSGAFFVLMLGFGVYLTTTKGPGGPYRRAMGFALMITAGALLVLVISMGFCMDQAIRRRAIRESLNSIDIENQAQALAREKTLYYSRALMQKRQMPAIQILKSNRI